MKTFIYLVFLAAGALAQNAAIGLPKAGQTVEAGSKLTVQVQRPNSLTGSQEMAVAIGLQSCANRECIPASEYMGQILYNGPFKPVYHESPSPPYQNFTVDIPESTEKGNALIGIAHATLVGASAAAFLETLNKTITIS